MAEKRLEPRTSKPRLKSSFSKKELEWRLQYTLARFGQIFVDAGGDLSEYVFKQYLPLEVLHYAFAVKWLEPPGNAKTVDEVEAMGQQDVVAWFDTFLELLPTDRLYSEWIESDRFRIPNPATTIKRFCILNHLHPTTTFVKLIAPQSDESVCFTTQRRIIRVMKEPEVKRLKKPNQSQREFSERLRQKMSTHDPKRFGALPLDDLLWLPKPEDAG